MKTFLLLCVALLLVGCQTAAGSGPIVAGVAAGIAALNELLAGGVITPIQYEGLRTGIEGAATIANAATGNAAEAGTMTKLVGGGATIAAAVMARWASQHAQDRVRKERGAPSTSASVKA